MLRLGRAHASFKLAHRRTLSSNANVPNTLRYTPRIRATLVASSAIATVLVYSATSRTVHNDTIAVFPDGPAELPPLKSATTEEGNLVNVVWGSNRQNLLSPDVPVVDLVRSPAIAKWLENVALRDLALHETHAVCVDARGDVYQWGNGFFDASDSKSRKPVLTLQGKNIVKVQATASKVFALSASGKVYTFSSRQSSQIPDIGKAGPTPKSWLGSFWGGLEENIDFVEITALEHLVRGEKFTSIAAGGDHLLALTSKGRIFAHPISKQANASGQLGIRHFDVPDPSLNQARLSVELIPKSLADPFAKTSAFSRRAPATTTPAYISDNLKAVDDRSIRFCDKLLEVPSLRGVNIVRIAAGSRSSYVQTEDGRVLGWGANEYGQIGLGSNVTLDTITIPTEIVLWRNVPGRTRTKCQEIYAGKLEIYPNLWAGATRLIRKLAGGDLACFAVERTTEGEIPTTDVLVCGNGQWGGLGNNIYSNAQGNPVRAKNVSGLLEFSETSQKLEAIVPHAVCISPTGHVLLTLDTMARSGPGGDAGRDLVVWGKNHEYELGNGKKSSLSVPTSLHKPDGNRFMLRKLKAKEVRDLRGNVWKKGVEVEQCAVAGYGTSVVFWKIC